MASLDRIVVDPGIRFGKPSVRGTRITVGEVLVSCRRRLIQPLGRGCATRWMPQSGDAAR
jgi:hypothetical protein